ncbi:MAG TPA: hypothetical protein VD735_04810 [Candidatus Saccharimonadales bacterium]|nr:hypothetical protein [Candidatus Saccharimonadales bacterium]
MSFEHARSPANKLQDAKLRFGQAMLENDAFFEMLQKREQSGASRAIDRNLPDFLCEPTYVPQEDGSARIGVQLTRGRQDEVADGIGIGIGLVDRITIADVDIVKKRLEFNPEVVDEEGTARELFGTWWSAWAEIHQTMGDEVGIHPLMYTLELSSKLENMHFQPRSD